MYSTFDIGRKIPSLSLTDQKHVLRQCAVVRAKSLVIAKLFDHFNRSETAITQN